MKIRRWALPPALALAVACGGDANQEPISAADVLIRISAGAAEVELGRAFPLTVLHSWSEELVPEEWSDEALAPLVLKLQESTRRAGGGHVEETRRYWAYAFALGDFTVPAVSFTARPKEGGVPRAAHSQAFTIRVLAAVDPAAPGPAELPGEPLPAPRSPLPWWGGGVAASAALALVLWHLRRRAPPPVAAAEPGSLAPPPAPHLRALERLQRLRGLEPQGAAQLDAYYVEASAVLRDYLEERFGLRVRERTTEELLAAPETARLLPAQRRADLAAYFAPCDLAKFAALAPPAAERARLLAAAQAFVLETHNGSAAYAEHPPSTVIAIFEGPTGRASAGWR